MPNRESVACTLPPEKAERLRSEAEERLLAPSKIIEAALDRLWASDDATQTVTGEATA